MHQGLQSLVAARVLEVVQTVHRERRTHGLDVLAGLGNARFIHFTDDTGHDDGRQQADDDHDHHDLDECEAAKAGDGDSGLVEYMRMGLPA